MDRAIYLADGRKAEKSGFEVVVFSLARIGVDVGEV